LRQREHFIEPEANRNIFFCFSAEIFKSLPLLNSQRTFKKYTSTGFRRKRFLKKSRTFSTAQIGAEIFPRVTLKEQGS